MKENRNFISPQSPQCARPELTFLVFAIHALGDAWGCRPRDVYATLNGAGAIDGYILKCYNVLHTLSKKALVEDIEEFLSERGVSFDCVPRQHRRSAPPRPKSLKMKNADIAREYKENLEVDIILRLSSRTNMDLRSAIDVYYRSVLSGQIEQGMYGTENMSCNYLVEDLIENEPQLFAK